MTQSKVFRPLTIVFIIITLSLYYFRVGDSAATSRVISVRAKTLSGDSTEIQLFSGHGHTLMEADGLKLGYLVPVDAPDPETDE
jgi:hypothetical protein